MRVRVGNLHGLPQRQVAFRGHPGGQGRHCLIRVQPPPRPEPSAGSQPGLVAEDPGGPSLRPVAAIGTPTAQHHPGRAIQQHPARSPGEPANHAVANHEPETRHPDLGRAAVLECELQGLVLPRPVPHLRSGVTGLEQPAARFCGGHRHESPRHLHPDCATADGDLDHRGTQSAATGSWS